MSELPNFDSLIAIERATPTGGVLKFGVGALTWPDGRQEPAVAIQITHPDALDGVVAQFSLLMPTFEVLLDGMMDVFQAAKDMEAK